MTHLKVAVRIRPLSQREIESCSAVVTEIQDRNTIAVVNLKVPEQNAGDSRERIRRFTFDYCFRSNSTQDEVFEAVGKEIEDAIINRYHSCVLAYGQSSSGKTHTMMGTPEDPGLTPKLCRNIFKYLQDCVDQTETIVSYLEIYNEKVRDLLVSSHDSFTNQTNCLRVREHPKKGPYVQGLTRRTATDPETLLRWLKSGNANRRVAATLTNPSSSRSHSVFTVTCLDGVQVHLVDLAGSERACTGFRSSVSTLKEGANINRSLVALGNVISTLADQSARCSRGYRKRFVPYRDSVLTWLLKDTLGGNSRTVMIATASPSSSCYNETVNTLRFGQRAKRIVSRPIVNEDPKERTIRELRAEIARLKQLLAVHQDPKPPAIDQQSCSPPTNPDPGPEKQGTRNCDPSPTGKRAPQLPLIENGTGHGKSSGVTSAGEELHSVCMKREELVPVMDVTSAIELPQRVVPKIRRTYSVETPKSARMEPKTRPFGSAEAIASAAKDRPRRASILQQKQIPATKTSLLRQALENSSGKSEKGTVTEVKGPQPTKAGSIARKTGVKPRSQIVAAVTSRLYGTSRKKEASTETLASPPCEEVPRELTICANARTKLQELTHKALKANRRRAVETQTDLFPVLRIKEISTDVDDLKVALGEVRDAGTGMVGVEMRDASVACAVENFGGVQDCGRSGFVVTRSCGTQSLESLTGSTTQKPRDQQPPTSSSGISFTKYLQNNMEPTFQIVNPCTANPIYTSSVNINVNHNYINRTRLADTVSDDSLETDDTVRHSTNNVCFPTPDIISNHNSLEHGNSSTANSSGPQPVQQGFEEKRATSESYAISEHFSVKLPQPQPSVCVATLSTTPKCQERLGSIDFATVCAPEVCMVKGQEEERCGPFWRTPEPELLTPIVSEVEPLGFPVLQEPIVLKSIMKYQEVGDAEEAGNAFADLPDSLTFHESHAGKRVRFSSSESERMMKAMSRFVEEATTLMSNLTMVASKLQSEQSYDLEVTVNGISGLSEDQKGLSLGVQGFNSSSQDFDATPEDFAATPEGFAASPEGFTATPKGFTATPEGFTATPKDFAATPEGFAATLKGFIATPKGFAATPEDFAATPQHFPSNRQGSPSTKHDFSSQTLGESSSQTSPRASVDASANTDFQMPLNEYEAIVRESCDRLERCILKANARSGRKIEEEHLHRFPQPFSVDPAWSAVEDSSLDSTRTYSDYGSLPRLKQGRRRSPSCSPSAYLKQLTCMRRQIVESSRDDQIGEVGASTAAAKVEF